MSAGIYPGSCPRILGHAGHGLEEAAWLDHSVRGAVAQGRGGELATARTLNAYALPDNGPTVIHDVMVPSSRYKANIDHLVVVGNTVHIIDAKVWKPGRYWTWRGQTRRGLEKFEPADKKTLVIAAGCIETHLAHHNVLADVADPVVVIYPSSKREPLNTRWLRVPGGVAMSPDRFKKHAKAEFSGRRTRGDLTADPRVVAALVPLISTWKPAAGAS